MGKAAYGSWGSTLNAVKERALCLTLGEVETPVSQMRKLRPSRWLKLTEIN